MASRVKSVKFLRCCPICIKDDFSKFGENYWHRSHQLAGVYMCWKHKIFLSVSNVQVGNARYLQDFTVSGNLEAVINDQKIDEAITKQLEKIAVISRNLLVGNYSAIDKVVIADKYKKLLIERKLASLTESLYVKKLLHEFLEFYPPKFLQLIGCEFRGTAIIDDNWLLRILRKPKSVQHPLYHILLINFLSRHIDDFFKSSGSKTFFGESPWLCLNPAAKHYQQPVITELKKPRLYNWLYENDDLWLKENLPLLPKNKEPAKSYVDWNKRDLDIVDLVKQAAQKLLSDKGRPKQITKTSLGKVADCLSFLLIKLDKLPNTKEVLNNLIETREIYAVRRIKWVARWLRNNNQSYNKQYFGQN